MVRISDILKKKMQATTPPVAPSEAKPEEKPEPGKEKPSQKPETEVSEPSETTKLGKAMPHRESQEMQIAKVMKELEPDIERSNDLYSKLTQLAKELLINVEEKKSIELKPIKDLLEEIINYVILGDKTLFTFFYNDYIPEEYFYNHMVNAMVMSVGMGLKLGYNKSRLNELGLAAFLHEIGMTEVKKIALQHRTLSEEEFDKIRKHPDYGAKFLLEIKDITSEVISAVKEEHERMNGKGYPEGLRDGEISEYARIIATVDVYEALTHSRVYRKRLSPYEAIKEMILSSNSLFDSRIFKILIDLIGIYPIGSYAQLNSDEIAKVVTVNDDFPLRPVVKIIFDANKNRLKEPHLINLAKEFNLYIKRPLPDEEVSRLIKK